MREYQPPTKKPTPNERPFCQYPRWDGLYDHVWLCCHGGTGCGGCATFPQSCKPKGEEMDPKLEEFLSDSHRKAESDLVIPERRHNWLYSVVPLFPEIVDTVIKEHGGIYLAGYCKDCRNAFTVSLKTSTTWGHVIMDKLDIPTTGCIPV